MNNLSQYDHHRDTAAAAKDDAAAAAAAGYASADDAAPNNSGKNRDRKRGPTNTFWNSLPRFIIYINKYFIEYN